MVAATIGCAELYAGVAARCVGVVERCWWVCACPGSGRDPVNHSDAQVQTALGWSCDICGAGKGVLCRNTIRPDEPLPGRVVHEGRLLDRRRQPKIDE